jgi:hypothetical protein
MACCQVFYLLPRDHVKIALAIALSHDRLIAGEGHPSKASR